MYVIMRGIKAPVKIVFLCFQYLRVGSLAYVCLYSVRSQVHGN